MTVEPPQIPPTASQTAMQFSALIEAWKMFRRARALRFFATSSTTTAEKLQAREMLAVVLLEIGDVDAKQTFRTIVSPHPDTPSPPPASAYLYLAQLTDDDPHAALTLYSILIRD
ncbi:hypothetical protein JVU11DRAFT_9236 [Chiua virens]|nr:hypothetical protein JVU11DRAFT_9236 [Chiua virens]